MHFQVIGAPEGKPTLVFVNSLGTDFRIWRDVIVRLAGEAGIVAYDKRGHGLTDAPPQPYAMLDHVRDLAALLDSQDIASAIVCGISVGGQIALGLAEARPDLVKGLVLCDTAHKIGTNDSWNARIAAVEGEGIASVSDGILKLWFTEPFRRERPDQFSGYRNMLERQPVSGYAGTCAALRDSDYTEAARTMAVPALCVVGDEDGSTPPDLVRSLADLMPDAAFEVVEGAGHLPCIEKPGDLTALIRGFLGRF